MTATRRWPSLESRWLLLPLLLFLLVSTALFWKVQGQDLASSYVGCRILLAGRPASLYSHDATNFAAIGATDTLWPHLAAGSGYKGDLHPYVQTPLWAWALKPLCGRTRWSGFEHLFLLLALLSVAGCVLLTALWWTPRFATPVMLGAVLLLLGLSQPFIYAIVLVQTHAPLLLLTVAGLILAENDRPLAAGFCVAVAAVVKITPAVLLLYWCAARRWRAAFSLAVALALLTAITRITTGHALFAAYLQDMHRLSHVLLVAENNQSLAAWWMGRSFAPDEIFDVNAFPLPDAVRLVSLGAMAACALLGGLLDRHNNRRPQPSFGAGMVLVAMTVFAPIAWTHYFIVLAIPLMMLVQAALTSRSSRTRWILIAGVIGGVALLFPPLAPDVLGMNLSDYAVLRNCFCAGMLCLVLLGWTGWRARWLPRAEQGEPA